MTQHPMDFLRKYYIEPMGVTQDELCDHLSLGKKTVSELYQQKRGLTVSTAKKFGLLFGINPEKLLQMQVAFELVNDQNVFHIKPLELPANTRSLLKMLNVNRSDEAFTTKDLFELFKEKKTFPNKTLVTILFTKVPLSKVVKYMGDMRIGLSHLKHLYAFYTKKLGGKPNKSYERLLADNDKTAVVKICDNGKYFDDPREFEEYLFYRLRVMRHKKLLKDLSEDTAKSQEVRQRAMYLYSFATGKKVKSNFNPKPTKLYASSRRSTTDLTSNTYGVLGGVDTMRFNQFVNTGSY